MSGRVTAGERLVRILRILPEAVKATEEGDGLPLSEAAELVDATVEEVVSDVRQVAERAFYQPAGEGDRLRVSVTGERLRAWTTGEFRRPVKLTPRETLALSLGLRGLVAVDDGEHGSRRLDLARRLERELASRPAEELEELSDGIALQAPEGAGEVMLARLDRAARERRRCRLRYLKPDAAEPEERVVAPYALVQAEGRWYAVGHSQRPDAVRVFRLDRVLEAELLTTTFEVPEEFDPSDYLSEGRVYRAGEEVEATVRYSPKIARWIRERWDGERSETRPDGSFIVRHRVADPRWLVRHVLEYGPEAEVLAPQELRWAVRDAASRVAG